MKKFIGKQKFETETLAVKEIYIAHAKKDEYAACKLVNSLG